MRRALTVLFPVICLSATVSVVADPQSTGHSHGPHGGALVALGDGGHHVELLVDGGEVVTARVLDKNKKPVATDAAHLTLTFTEKDGEKEDYRIPVKKPAEEDGVFQRKSAHVVDHIMRDTITVKVEVGGEEHASKSFAYPHGPNGGELIGLGTSGLHAELVVREDIVRIHVLDKRKRSTKVDAKELTLTFTEKDGETENYNIPAATGNSRGTVFERKSDHVVKHVKRDKITVRLTVAGSTLTSKTFAYPGK